jgi:hypothetical protein
VFACRFDVDAAEAVCGFGDIQVPEIAGLLGSLVDKSLVVAEPALEAFRYRLLETIRLFAAEQLAKAGGEEAAAIAAGHCAHFLAVAEAAAPYLTGPEQGRWLARLDPRPGQPAARRPARGQPPGRDRGGAAARRRAVAVLDGAVPGAGGLHAARAGAAAAGGPRRPALFAAALFAAAMVGCFVDVPAAVHFAEQAVQVARPLGDERLLISALAALGGAHFFSGDAEAGLPFGREAVERARRLGDDVLLGMSLGIYAVTLGAIDPAGCPPLYAEAFAWTRRSGDHLIDCDLHLNSSLAAVGAGDLPAARAHLDAAARAARQIGWEHVYITLNLGGVQRAEGDIDAARFTWQAALRASRRKGEYPAMASACHSLAVLAGDAGDWHRAAVLHGAVQALVDRTGGPWDEDAARERRDSLGQARAHLGDEQLERAYAQGMALSLDQALDPALGKAGPA